MNAINVVVDTAVNPVVRARDGREEALPYVTQLIETNGDVYTYDLAVGRLTVYDEYADALSGSDLLASVRAAVAERERVDARRRQPPTNG